jgi:acid phosphatase class B
MAEMFDKTKTKIRKGYTTAQKMVRIGMVWGLIFSVVTLLGLHVGFDYDDTLVNSKAAFEKAIASGASQMSPQFWKVVNESFDLEQPKVLSNIIAWAFRLAGFKVIVIAARGPEGGEELKKEWRHLVSKIIFATGPDAKRKILGQSDFLLFFGDSDTDIQQSRLAKVYPVRIRRSLNSIFKEDYHPGTLHELVIPLSEY